MDPIDKLLAQLKAEYEAGGAAQPTSPPPSRLDSAQSQSWQFDSVSDPVDDLLAKVKVEYEAQDQAEQLRQAEQQRQEQLRQAQLQAQQRAALTAKAQDWLKHLDVLSTEGIWFEQFSSRYNSRLEAAIDYLQALESGTDPSLKNPT
jgi:DNA segregation ATPase FtsK/SpoIIIE-like protein